MKRVDRRTDGWRPQMGDYIISESTAARETGKDRILPRASNATLCGLEVYQVYQTFRLHRIDVYAIVAVANPTTPLHPDQLSIQPDHPSPLSTCSLM